MAHPRHRRVALALAASALLHAVAAGLAVLLLPTELPRYVALPRALAPRSAPTRFEARAAARAPAWSWSPRQRSGLVAPEFAIADAAAVPEVAADSALTATQQPGTLTRARPATPEVALPEVADLAPMPAPLPASGPQMLEDLARRQTVVVVDPRTGKLRWARLFLPAEGQCGKASRAKLLDDLLHGVQKGLATSRAVPIEYVVEATPCGHLLTAAELQRYRVILTDFIGVESPAALAQHLAAGGFALTDPRTLAAMVEALERDGERRVERVALTVEHPLFRAYNDIEAATFAGMEGVEHPLPGLEVDGRLAAVAAGRYRLERTSGYAGTRFVGAARKPWLANLLYVDALAYGLVQPSALGGRYLARD